MDEAVSARRVPSPSAGRPGSGAVADPAEGAAPAGSDAPVVGKDAADTPGSTGAGAAAAPVANGSGPAGPAEEPATSVGDEPTTAVPPVAAAPGIDGPTTFLPDGARRGGTGGRTKSPARGGRRPSPPPGPRPPSSGPIPVGPRGALVPGTVIADRYRLVAEVGRDRAADAALWKARDTTLERDVAMTLLVGGWQADARASSALSRATRSAHFAHRHAARVLDVIQPGSSRLPQGVLGAAVAEWTPGRDLAELVAGGPLSPSAALRVVEPLAQAVADAHRAGLVLGLDHPQRVRVTARANARLAFPMPRGDAEVDDDVRGLGAILYLLLTGRWPAIDGATPAGLTAAPRTAAGGVAPVRDLRPALPVGLAALVDRTLDATGGIRTAAAVHGLVRQLREGAEDDGVLLPLTEDGVQLADDDGAVWHPDDEDGERRDPETRRKLRIGVTLLVVAVLAIVAFVAFQAVSLLGGGPSSGPPLVIPTTAPAAAPSASQAPAVPSVPAAPSGPVQLASIAVYDPSGNPDNPDRVGRAADNDPSTTWATSDYRQQFPALKPGIGLMTTFRTPSRPTQVVVRSPSPGTTIEIRSAAAPNLPLAQTQVLGTGTVSGDTTTIPLQAGAPTSNLLVWITALGQSDGQYASQIAEVTVIGGS
ncbi:protein kinase family protein [Actinomycetospora chiangmaiensis]|uniref:protein kinase family protein n=1 Tax=Actinomycetospora chiangmaiensis TaxID=402650 RepID=UPI0003665A9E|nr:protein kinase family protein [Actinomycetospora chiangmaiensis]